jgi:RND family efflux transporter MFP subunit
MKTAVIALGLLFAALIVAGVAPRIHDARELEAESARVVAAPQVAVVAVKRSLPTSDLVLPGSIEALHESPIYARTTGYVAEWHSDIGAHVVRGQLLAQIESPEIDRQTEQAKADLGQLRATVALTKQTLDRWLALAKDSVVTTQEVDERQAAYDVAVASLASGEANYQRLLELQRFERVTAPFTGVVTARSVDVGDLVTAGATLGAGGSASAKPLFGLARTDTVRVYVDVPQSAMQLVQPNAPVDVLVREQTDRVFRGTVARNAHALDAASRTLLTEVQIPNPKGILLPGMYVQVRFTITSANPALVIPANTLVIRSDGPQVAVVQDDNRIHYQKIELGRDFGDHLEVTAGLDEHARLVINPSDDVREGIAVRVLAPVGDAP